MQTEMKAQVWAKTKGHCWYCGALMNPWEDFTVDHMDSQKNGGGNEIENLVPACKTCNSRKNAKSVEQYRGYLLEKQTVKFWGEIQTNALVPVTAKQEEGEASDETEMIDYEVCYEAIIDAMDYAWEVRPQMVRLLVALVEFGHSVEQENVAIRGWAGMDDLWSKTRQPKETILTHLFFLEEQKLLEFFFGEERTGIHYRLVISGLEGALCDYIDRWFTSLR